LKIVENCTRTGVVALSETFKYSPGNHLDVRAIAHKVDARLTALRHLLKADAATFAA
jgi:hypothetical protein